MSDLRKVRIDKWLWAARFFKTRNIAKQAIEGGKVHCDGQRVKASKEIGIGVFLRIRQGWDEKEVEVIALSDQRRGAPEAAKLYSETADSVAKREQGAAQRKLLNQGVPRQRPSKRDKRLIRRFLEQDHDD